MAVISTLVARMIADLSGWTPNMEKGKRDMSGFGAAAKMLKGTLASLGVSLSAAAVVFGALKLSRRANETIDLARGLGMTVENLQSLRYVMAASGGESDALAKGLFQFIRRIQVGGEGIDQTSITMRKYGLTLEELKRNPQEAIRSIIATIDRLGVTTRVTADMFQLFGRATTGLFPILTGGIQNFDKLTNEAKKYGVTLSEIQLKQAEVMSIQVEKLKEVTKAYLTSRLAFLTAYSGLGTPEMQKEVAKYEKMANKMPPGILQHSGTAQWSPTTWAVNMAMQSLSRKALKSAKASSLDEGAYEDYQERLVAFYKTLETPVSRLNEQFTEMKSLLDAGQITNDQYAEGLEKIRSEMDKISISENKWATDLIEKSQTPMEKYKEGLLEVLKLRQYFMRDNVLMASEQATLINLAQKYQDEAVNDMKPERLHRQRDSFMELSPLMSVSGLQIGESLEQQQAQDIAAIRARLESMTKEIFN